MRQAEFHRRQRRDADREVPLSGVQPAASAGSIPAEKREERERLERALDQLPEKQRELIAQREYLGASWQAIADDLGYASPEVARVRHARCWRLARSCGRKTTGRTQAEVDDGGAGTEGP